MTEPGQGWEENGVPYARARKRGGETGREPPEPTLEDCPVTPLGKRGLNFYYFQTDGELVIMTAGQHTRRGLMGLLGAAGVAWAKRHFQSFDQNGEAKKGSWSDDRCALWLMSECIRAGVIDPAAPVRGPGVWRAGGGLLVHCGDVLITTEPAETLPAGRKIDGVLYPSAPPIARPAKEPAAAAAGKKLLKALRLWNFRDKDIGPELVCGFIGAAFLGGAPAWRPHVLVIAKHGSGKSWLAEFQEAVLGAGAHPLQNNYSEAGLRQALTGEARAILLDEAEAVGVNSRVRAVIELLRHVSGGQGSRAVRGTTGGKAMGYQVTGCAFLCAILPPPLSPQDRSRIMTLELAPIDSGEEAGRDRERVQAAMEWARAHSAALRARAIGAWPLFLDAFGRYHAALLARGCSMRQADQLGTLLAGRDALIHDVAPDTDSAEAEVERFAHLIDVLKQDDEDGEGEQCLNHLMSWPTDLWRSGDRRTVGELVANARQSTGSLDREALPRIGLRVQDWRKPGQNWLIVANQHVGLDRIFAGTRWEGGAWATALRYLDNAKAWGAERFAGAVSRGTGLPDFWLPHPERVETADPDAEKTSQQLADGDTR